MSESLSTEGVSNQVAALPLGANMQIFTASGNFTVPDGVTNIKARMWGGGGGGGGGCGDVAASDGGNGVVGSDSEVLTSSNKARGGNGGFGGIFPGTHGELGVSQSPVLAAGLAQFGSLAFSGASAGASRGQNEAAQNGFGIIGAASGVALFIPGGDGQANTGQAAGGGGTSTNGGGGGAAHGEYAEASISVTPAQVIPVTVGPGGTPGAGGDNGSAVAGLPGGTGGSGFVIIEW